MPRRKQVQLWIVPLAVLSLLAASAGEAFGASPGGSAHAAPKPSKVRAVKNVRDLKPAFAAAVLKPKPYVATKTKWPAASTATVALGAPAAGATRGAQRVVTSTPVLAQSVAVTGGRAYAGPGSLKVSVLDHKVADAAGIPGVLMTVSADKAGPAAIGVDYSGFAEAYGGNYAASLVLATYPACVLSTPAAVKCRTATPLTSSNNMDTHTVSATVSVPTAGTTSVHAATSGLVLAVTADTTGDDGGSAAGTYQATTLKPSGSWSAGGSTGSFTYNYPISLPDAPSDLVPGLDLSYDSAVSDGETAATESQSSWVGEGWSTPESYIEQSFQDCAESPEGTAAPSKVFDQCYDGPIYTMSLSGTTTALVWDKDKKIFRTEGADGSTIVHFCTLPSGKTSFTDPTCTAGTSNASGTFFNDWWQVKDRDGNTYSFGMNHLPGWTTGKTATSSVAYQPVYSAHSGDPCFNTTFSAAVCTMPYRWGMDYATDTHHNAMAYYYHPDTNSYGAFNTTTPKSYVRDLYPTNIDYGFTDGNAYGTVPDKVVFTTSPRCVTGTCTLNATNAPNFPDVPFTRVCSASTCSEHAPSYFSTVRLTGIATQQYSVTAAKYDTIDSYTLSQSMPQTGDGTAPTLWLDQISHTGSALAGLGTAASTADKTPITVPPVKFLATPPMANRLDTQSDGLPAYFKYRLGQISTETGSNITISYELPKPCSASAKPTVASNTSSCYPVSWTPDSFTAPITDWFNKYAVKQVSQDDPTGHAPAQVTSYDYQGAAAWHFDDNEMVKAKYRTYGQFRGYGTVDTYLGDGKTDTKAKSETTYYRGMSKNNNTTAVNVTDSLGGVHEDVDDLAGQELESSKFLGDDLDTSTITSYWVSDSAAGRARPGLPDLTSTWVAPVEKLTRQAITSTGSTTWRNTETDTSYVSSPTDANFGLPVREYTHTSPIDPAYSRCTTTTYAPRNTTTNLGGLVAESETDAVACDGFTAGDKPSAPGAVNTLTAPAAVSRPAQVVSDTRNFYDDPTFSTTFPQTSAPATGDVTMVRKAADYTAGAFTWQTTNKAKYDSVGRKTDDIDGDDHDLKTAYITNSIGLITGTKVTNGLNQSISSTIETERGQTTTKTDANGAVTTSWYDPLGRGRYIWLNGRATTAAADRIFTYAVSNTGPTAVTTQQLNDQLGYQLSTLIYDGLLRPRQTQEGTPGQGATSGGRLINDTFYDSRGWVSGKYTDWWDSNTTPNISTVTAEDLNTQVPTQDSLVNDSLGRVVIDQNKNNGVLVSTTTTVYNGDRTTVIPPTGGTVSTTLTDPLGRTTEVDNYLTRPAVNSPANPFTSPFTITGGTSQPISYGFDSHGNQNTTTQGKPGDGKPTWTSTYNLLGRVTSQTDPDAGTTTGMTYDGAGNLLQYTDSRGKTTSYSYDTLSRRVGAFTAAADAQILANAQTGTTGNQIAAWVYDNSTNVANLTHAIGKLSATVSYQDGHAYTEQQTDFNIFGESLGTSVTIPAADGALAGTYTVKHLYTPNTGLLLKDIYTAQGGLPAEQVLHTYTSPLDLPSGVGGLNGYIQTTSYDALSRINETRLGTTATTYVAIDNTYDPNSGRLTGALASRTAGGTTTTLDQQSYRYDLDGNLLGQTSTRQGSADQSETQCYDYDGLDQLVGAWTANDNCATQPTAGNSSMVTDPLGAGSAYWTTWSIDALGDRSGQTQHAVSGGPAADTTTSYGYGTNGQQPHTLTSTSTTGGAAASTSYRYDAAGNMTGRNAGHGNQTIAYNDAGDLTSITGSTGGDSSFTYDADGTLLLQRDPGTTTLYLGDQQFALNTTTGAVTGTRYYSLPGGVRAVRTGSGTNFGWEISDQHDTPVLYLDSQMTTPQWRQYTPNGAPRGASITPFDNRGFLNKATDTTTGLTIVGARQYDPDTGRFITLDPILEQIDPTQLNGYGYAGNNPVVHADPTGLRIDWDSPASDTNHWINQEAKNEAAAAHGHGNSGGGHIGGTGGGWSGGDTDAFIQAAPAAAPKSKCGYFSFACKALSSAGHHISHAAQQSADWFITNGQTLQHITVDGTEIWLGALATGAGGAIAGIGIAADGTLILAPVGIGATLLGAGIASVGITSAAKGAQSLGKDARDLQWNTDSSSAGGGAEKDFGTKAVDDGDFQHVLDRHRDGGELTDPKASRFTGKEKVVRKRIAETINRGTPTKNDPDPVTKQPRPGQKYRWNFGQPVGKAGPANGGGDLNSIEVVVNEGKIVTAYPY
jgi:RHS repeat-associated protein